MWLVNSRSAYDCVPFLDWIAVSYASPPHAYCRVPSRDCLVCSPQLCGLMSFITVSMPSFKPSPSFAEQA